MKAVARCLAQRGVVSQLRTLLDDAVLVLSSRHEKAKPLTHVVKIAKVLHGRSERVALGTAGALKRGLRDRGYAEFRLPLFEPIVPRNDLVAANPSLACWGEGRSSGDVLQQLSFAVAPPSASSRRLLVAVPCVLLPCSGRSVPVVAFLPGSPRRWRLSALRQA